MKVALVRPNYQTYLITPPLGLGYISSYLKKEGHEVIIVDGLNRNLTNSEIVKLVRDCQIVGINILTDYYLQAKDLARRLKAEGKIVVLGGVHPSVMPKESIEECNADFIVVGEGEETMDELVKAIENKKSTKHIKGLYSRNNFSNFKPREPIQNLDSLPFPDWKSIDPRKYQKAPHGAIVKNFPVGPITSTRGCPYECTFCASPKFWCRKLRYRSPENVVDEIEYLIKHFGVKEIHFEDDNLTLNRGHIESICKLILKRNINIPWATPNGIRADKVDEPLLRLMKKAGCYFVVFGVESGNQEILNTIKKHETLKDVERAVRLANKIGFITQGFFIFGLPGETEETIKKTIEFAKSIPLDRAQFLLFDLLPGSELWFQHKDEVKRDYSKRCFRDSIWIPDTITEEKLKYWQSRAFREFFFRPRQIISFIRYFKISQFKHVFNRLRAFRII